MLINIIQGVHSWGMYPAIFVRIKINYFMICKYMILYLNFDLLSITAGCVWRWGSKSDMSTFLSSKWMLLFACLLTVGVYMEFCGFCLWNKKMHVVYIGKLFLFKHKKIKSEYSMTWQNMPMSCRMLSCRMLIYFLVYEGKELKGCEFLFSILVGYWTYVSTFHVIYDQCECF